MNALERATRLHGDSIVIDPCVQYLTRRTARTDRSGLTAVGLTIPLPGDDMPSALGRVIDFLAVIAGEAQFCLADSVQAIASAHAAGRLAHILLAQDSLFLGTDLRHLFLWQQLGLRILQLTYNEQNLAGSGCLELNDGGLTQYGRVLIREMEAKGITLDLSHAGRRTFLDACRVAGQPPIVSHANPRRVVDNPRNIDDEQMRAVAAMGGVVCVTTWAPLIWPGTVGMPTLDDYLRCLEYAIDLIGIDHVGISTDSMGTMGAYPRHEPDPDTLPYERVTGAFDRRARPPDTNNRQPADFNGIEDLPLLTQKLVQRGYGDDDIRKLLGQNLMRVFTATWRPDLFS